MTNNLYQKSFNQALYKMRIATSSVLMDSEPLMRTLCKIMYDFSDDIKRFYELKPKEQGNEENFDNGKRI